MITPAELRVPPRICWVPPCVSSLAVEALDFCRSVGLELDDWQEFILAASLGLNAEAKWSAFEVGVNVARQNGKNEIALARELVGLFLLNERLVIHSAHEFKTSTEHQRRVEEIIRDNPDLDDLVKGAGKRKTGYKHSHGEEGIELRTGQRIRFMTRTKGGGRGHTGDLVVFDEAMILPDAMIGALMPTLSARSVKGNPQLWYFGTAVDQVIQEHGLVFTRVRERGIAADDPSLAYIEYSAAFFGPDGKELALEDITAKQANDPAKWLEANPALDIRIAEEHIAKESRSMDLRTFLVERCGTGDYPEVGDDASAVIDLGAWDNFEDSLSSIASNLCLIYDVPPSRTGASISAVGRRPDGLFHLEVIARGAKGDQVDRGTGWVADRLAELVEEHEPLAVLYAERSPAESLAPEIEKAGVRLTPVSTNEHAQACGLLVDAVDQETIRHLGQPELRAAVKNGEKRPLGESWAWSRKVPGVDIAPLVGVTLGLWYVSGLPVETGAWAMRW